MSPFCGLLAGSYSSCFCVLYALGVCIDAHPWNPKGLIDPVVLSHRSSTADSQNTCSIILPLESYVHPALNVSILGL